MYPRYMTAMRWLRCSTAMMSCALNQPFDGLEAIRHQTIFEDVAANMTARKSAAAINLRITAW
jgi:hypothetical protein